MSSLTKVTVIVGLLLLVGFTIVTTEIRPAPAPIVSEEVSINSNTTESKSVISYEDLGNWTCSWYGPGFHGKKTANGEIYDMMGYTAAHRDMEFGTLLKITNPKNNKSIIIRINDRGPVSKRFNLDLSKGSALELGILQAGVSKLKVEKVEIEGVNFPLISLN